MGDWEDQGFTDYWPMRRVSRRSTIISRFENGMEARRKRYSKTIREYYFRIEPLFPWQKVLDLVTFFESKSGAYATFTFHDPIDDEDVTVRFLTDELPVELRFKKPVTGQFATDGFAYFNLAFIEVL